MENVRIGQLRQDIALFPSFHSTSRKKNAQRKKSNVDGGSKVPAVVDYRPNEQ